jgi:Spy/CpxP family protein refolding chaperone
MVNWKVLLATVVIFGCGMITGAVLVNSSASSGNSKIAGQEQKSGVRTLPLQRVELLRRMEKNLSLSPQQKERIEKMMRESQERTKPLWDQIAPQMSVEMQRLREEMRKELTPEQKTKFEELLVQHPQKKNEETNTHAKPLTPAPETNIPTAR